MGNYRMLGCELCKKTIAIGKASCPLWYREEACLKALGEFLDEHEYHSLIYYTDGLGKEDYKEVIWR